MSKERPDVRDSDLVEAFVREDAASESHPDADSGGPEPADQRLQTGIPDDADATDTVYARCDAAIALTPRLAATPALAWAFAEANAIARSGPRRTPPVPWYRRLAVAWSIAAVSASASAAIALVTLWQSTAVTQSSGAPTTASSITFAPIFVPAGIEMRIAEIDPVVLIAENIPVDGRSVAVIPFGAGAAEVGGPDDGEIDTTAVEIYQTLLQQLAAMPGIYVIDPVTTAPYVGTELTPEEIARYLSVRSVVQGHVGYDGRTVSLDLTITDAAGAGRSIDRDFERPVSELAELQGDVMASLLDTLGAAPGLVPAPPN